MNRQQAIEMLMLLSAIECFTLSTSGNTLPDYLHDRLADAMILLKNISLGE